MYKGHSVSVVLPCYNEEEGVRVTLADMPSLVDEAVVVDNNCTDRTAQVASAMGAKVVVEATPGSALPRVISSWPWMAMRLTLATLSRFCWM
jgi:glycosyltransferase involved in cell wall biosynthesis